jgi:uncharacterized membrane protein
VLEEFMGVPVHPLLVHFPVVFVPMLALLTAGYVLAPFVRPHIRWVLGLLALGAPVSAVLARLSGKELFDRMDRRGDITEGFYPTIENHQALGTWTMWATIASGVLTLALVYFVGPRIVVWRLTDGTGWRRYQPMVLGALSLVAAGVSLYYVIRTGDSGGKAAWSGR